MSQTERLFKLLKDGYPHRTDQICAIVYGSSHLGLARIGARIWDIKQKYNVEISGKRDSDNPALYWYQLITPKISLNTKADLEDYNNWLYEKDLKN